MSAPENPPAFPNAWEYQNEHGVRFPFVNNGMSLRDWFAGQALAGIMAGEGEAVVYALDGAAARAFLLADAMLAERAKGAR